MNWQKLLEPPDHREERPLSAWHLVSDKMLRWKRRGTMPGAWNQHQHTFPTTPTRGEKHTMGRTEMWLDENGVAQRGASKRRTLPHWSCTLTVLPEFPDKAAVLLLLARNACGRQQSVNSRCSPTELSYSGRLNVTPHSEIMQKRSFQGGRVQGITLSLPRPAERNLLKRGLSGEEGGTGAGAGGLCLEERLFHKVGSLPRC